MFLPFAVAVTLVALPRLLDGAARWAWVATDVVVLGLVVAMWLRHAGDTGIGYEARRRWIPTLDSGYHVGVDGLSLPLLALTAVIFLACGVRAPRAAASPRLRRAVPVPADQLPRPVRRARPDPVFVFFDLSIVGMYFVIAGWGHGPAARSPLKFFLYTFLGSLALLVGFIGLYLASAPRSFDMVELVRQAPLTGRPLAGGLVLLAIVLGLAVKTPTVPFYTWLPPAYTTLLPLGRGCSPASC